MSIKLKTLLTEEIVELHDAVAKLEVMLRQYKNGDATATKLGRFTEAQIDAQITAAFGPAK